MPIQESASALREQQSRERAIHDWFMQYVIKKLLPMLREDNANHELKVVLDRLQVNFKRYCQGRLTDNIHQYAQAFLKELVVQPERFNVFPEEFSPILREKIMMQIEKISDEFNK